MRKLININTIELFKVSFFNFVIVTYKNDIEHVDRHKKERRRF